MNITFHTFINAVRHYWKSVMAITLIFALLGAGGGWYYGQQQMRPADGKAELLPEVDFSELIYNENYYVTCYDEVNKGYSNLKVYVNTLLAESSLEPAQKDLLKDFQREIASSEIENLKYIRERLEERNALYFPEEFLEYMVERYTETLAKINDGLLRSEVAVEIIKNMDLSDVTNENVMNSYNTLLTYASSYGDGKIDQLRYTQRLERLTQEPEKVVADGHEFFRDVTSAAEDLNKLIDRASQMANIMAAEKYFNLTLTYSENNVVTAATIEHTHRENDSQEIFQLLTIFCTLVGVCVGGFLAVCRQAKREKKEAETQSRMSSSDKAENAT